MIRTLLVLGITLAAASPARADLTHKIMSSISLQVGGAVTSADRIGSSFSISGSGVDTTDGTTANTVSAGTITSSVYAPGTIAATQDTPGEAFSFSQSYTQADAVPTSAVTTGKLLQTFPASSQQLLALQVIWQALSPQMAL